MEPEAEPEDEDGAGVISSYGHQPVVKVVLRMVEMVMLLVPHARGIDPSLRHRISC